MRTVPETNNRQDWPRLVAQAVNALANLVRSQGAAITVAEADIAAAETDISTLQSDVTTADGAITALQTATDWSALVDYADDAAAAAGSVPVGSLYRTGSVLKVRVS